MFDSLQWTPEARPLHRSHHHEFIAPGPQIPHREPPGLFQSSQHSTLMPYENNSTETSITQLCLHHTPQTYSSSMEFSQHLGPDENFGGTLAPPSPVPSSLCFSTQMQLSMHSPIHSYLHISSEKFHRNLHSTTHLWVFNRQNPSQADFRKSILHVTLPVPLGSEPPLRDNCILVCKAFMPPPFFQAPRETHVHSLSCFYLRAVVRKQWMSYYWWNMRLS